MAKLLSFLFLLVASQYCAAQVPKDCIMEFPIKPLNGKQVAITIRGGNQENERMLQVTIATGKDSGIVVYYPDVKISAFDETGNAIKVFEFHTVTLVHPHEVN